MRASFDLSGLSRPNILNFLAGLGMVGGSVLTIRHFFRANYPASIYEGFANFEAAKDPA